MEDPDILTLEIFNEFSEWKRGSQIPAPERPELQGELVENPLEEWCDEILEPRELNSVLEVSLGSPRFGPQWAAPTVAAVFGIILLTGTLGNMACALVTVRVL